MECQYCNKKLSSKSALLLHQRKTKYCLKIQGKSTDGDFFCEYCGQTFTYKVSLQNHYTTCSANSEYVKNILTENARQQIQLQELRKQVISLQSDKQDLQQRYDKLAETLAKRSTVTNNSINLNLGVFDKTSEDISRLVQENYNKEYLLEGQKGVAKFTHLHVLTSEDKDKPPIYFITDKSRGNGKYKVSDTEIVTDIAMQGLTKKVHPSIKKKALDIAAIDNLNDDKLFEGYQEVYNMSDDNGIFRKELIRILGGE